MDLSGRTALVTGGTRGIGAAVARRLAASGMNVVVAGRRTENVEALLQELRAHGGGAHAIRADMADPEKVTACVAETVGLFGGVEVVVHSAGEMTRATLLEETPERWLDAFAVHVHAAFHLARAAFPAMQRANAGCMILISSVAGLRGCPGGIAYQTVKGAVVQLTRALAMGFAKDNIRVNCVAPGIIDTDIHKDTPKEWRQYSIDSRIPLRREGRAEDVASAILELVRNDYITGETLTIDGGLTMRIA